MGGASLRTLCLVGAIALLSKLLGTSSIGFSIAVQQDAGNKSSAASPGRPRMGSRFYTSAAGQSSTDYGLTKGESKLLAKVVQQQIAVIGKGSGNFAQLARSRRHHFSTWR